jgi:hypothetical protein
MKNNNWISLSERLPELGETVLVIDDDGRGRAYTARLNGNLIKSWDIDAQDDYATLDEFSHWMPLPEI